MIELINVSRWYGQVIGLNDVSCSIAPGITALLGPNGAGKSTMLKLITGQLRPTTGTVTVFGEAPFANPNVYRRLGFCPETEGGYEDMTGRAFVTMLATMAGIARSGIGEAVDWAIETVGMKANADRQIGGYSKGMRQRIKVAQGIVHDPDILVLDEPLNGLDPVGRREMSVVLSDFVARGRTVLLSSHILYEVEQLTQSIMLLHQHRLLAQGDIHGIRALIDRHPHHIGIETVRARDLAQRLLGLPYVLSARLNGVAPTRVNVETRSPDRFYDEFPEIVLNEGYVIDAFDSPDNNLEAVFRYLVGA